MAKTEYVKNGHTRLHCAGVKLSLLYLGDLSASLGLRAKGHVRYAIRFKSHWDIELLSQNACCAE